MSAIVKKSELEKLKRYKPYPAYKDSGVEWLGKVPEHWNCFKLKRVTRLAYGDSFNAREHLNGEFNAYGSNGIIGKSYLFNVNGPSIIIGRKGSFGKINYSDGSCFAIDTTFYIDNKLTKANIRWLYYCLQILNLDIFSKDSAVPGLSREEIYDKDIPYCDVSQQKFIANFLDRETAKIDALIAKQERLIELLHEKRAALITRAVTKGLDPDVPMKESGVEWLGEIPAHWEVKKITWVYSFGSGTTPQTDVLDYYDGNIPWVTTSELRENVIETTLKLVSEKAMEDYSVLKIYPAGSLLIAMYGATIGRMGILGVSATVNQACCVLYQPADISTKYTFYWLESYRPILISWASGGGQPNLSQDVLQTVRITLPPLTEQDKIVTYIKQEIQKIDGLAEKIHESIRLLTEYRTALISAAVTGKIDVCGEVS